jgi:hypothetical protein
LRHRPQEGDNADEKRAERGFFVCAITRPCHGIEDERAQTMPVGAATPRGESVRQRPREGRGDIPVMKPPVTPKSFGRRRKNGKTGMPAFPAECTPARPAARASSPRGAGEDYTQRWPA